MNKRPSALFTINKPYIQKCKAMKQIYKPIAVILNSSKYHAFIKSSNIFNTNQMICRHILLFFRQIRRIKNYKTLLECLMEARDWCKFTKSRFLRGNWGCFSCFHFSSPPHFSTLIYWFFVQFGLGFGWLRIKKPSQGIAGMFNEARG